MCFEVLGFDVILDSNLKPWLLEINYTPSFTTDTALDLRIKKGVVKEAMELMEVSLRNRAEYAEMQKEKMERRMYQRKIKRLTYHERRSRVRKAQLKRTAHEDKYLRNYERIYPAKDPA